MNNADAPRFPRSLKNNLILFLRKIVIELRPPIRTVSILILALMIVIPLHSCRTSPTPTAPRRQISCDFIFDQEAYSECLARAKAGDANAAFSIAKLYDEPFSTGRLGIKKDRTTAFYWYKVAANLGHEKALRIVFDSYYFGRYGPENKAEAERYLKHAAKLGHQWAMLLLAHWSEKKEPEKAMNLYLELARKDNCVAQRKLAEIYFKGDLVPQDLCKSYFWALLASAGGFDRKSDNHHLVGSNYTTSFGFCLTVISEKYKAEKELGSKYVQMVQDAASRWRKGLAEPDFPSVQIVRKEKPVIGKIRPPDSLDFSKSTSKEKPLKWTPAQIDLNRHLTSNLTPSEVFNLVNPSVWTIISASSSANLKAMNNVSLASAVAISKNRVLTNYHVIEERPYVVVKQEGQFEKATVISGDKLTDRCIIHVENLTLKPVPGFRRYGSLTIGESVYSVGSPKGLENTLGQGIISGKRELSGLKLIQTTAQISKGSSGGGLFDRFGNLIGITTFKLADSEGLNFAIAIDNFIE
jgi:serine protease Do